MRYKILTKEGIEKAKPSLRDRKTVPDLSKFEVIVGSHDLLDDSILTKLAADIRKLQVDVERAKLPPEELDRRCFDLIHAVLKDKRAVAGDMNFWVRFAVRELASVIYKRFPPKKTPRNPTGQMNLDNFGLGSRGECWPYKLWVRGELSYDADNTKDPYALGRLGGVDIWTSHVHRQNFMSIQTMFRSVLAFQYPKTLKGKPLLFEGQENDTKRGFRTLIKRLRENWASVEYVHLDESDALSIVTIHSKGLHAADGKSVL